MTLNLLSPIPGPLQYQSASPCTLDDQQVIDSQPADIASSDWCEPSFRVIEHDERGRELIPTRVLALTPGYLAFAADDLASVKRIIGPFGEFLPLQTTQGRRWYFRPLHYLNGFAAPESGAKYSSDGKRVISFKTVAIRNLSVHSVGVFKVKGLRRSPVLYRPDIVERLLETNLFTGVEFKIKGIALRPSQ